MTVQIRSPPGSVNPLGANYAHVIVAEDFTVNAMLQGAEPLAASSWSGKTGVSEPPPGGGSSPEWGEWAGTVKVDMDALHRYARAVHEATDEYLSSLSDEALERAMDLSAVGLSEKSVAWMLNAALISNVNLHCGEISCLKGLQGVKGFPM